MWDAAGTDTNLNHYLGSGWNNTEATEINNSGET